MQEQKITHLLKTYGESHQNKTNKRIHWVCVPLIFYTLYGLIRLIPVPSSIYSISPYFNWGNLILLLALLYYIFLSIPLFFGFIFWSGIVIIGNQIILQNLGFYGLLWFSIIVFALAWVGQFIGHHIEGKKPSFLKDLQFLLIGPAWLMNFIFKVVDY